MPDQPKRGHMTYSVIIPTYNEGRHLRETVASVLSTATAQTEVIVVNDSSTDGSADCLRGLNGVVVLRNASRSGVAVSRANGMDAATGDWLVCIDAHNTFPVGWQDAIARAATQLEGGYGYLLGSELHYGDYHITGTYYPEPNLYPHQLPRQAIDAPYAVMSLPGGCHIIRRDYYNDIGGYDRGMLPPWGGEDMELSLRVWMLGGEVCIIPGLEITTLFKPSFPADWHMTYEVTIANVMRVAYIYLDAERLSAYITTQQDHFAYEGARSLMLGAGTVGRASDLARRFVRTTDELFERFGIDW